MLRIGPATAILQHVDQYGGRHHAAPPRRWGVGPAAWRNRTFDATRATHRTWLLMLTHRKAVDRVRHEQRRSHLPMDTAVDPASTGRGPEELAMASHMAPQVRAALTTLPRVQQEALALAYWGGYKQREIAEITQTPVGTVKTRKWAGISRCEQPWQTSTATREMPLLPALDSDQRAPGCNRWRNSARPDDVRRAATRSSGGLRVLPTISIMRPRACSALQVHMYMTTPRACSKAGCPISGPKSGGTARTVRLPTVPVGPSASARATPSAAADRTSYRWR